VSCSVCAQFLNGHSNEYIPFFIKAPQKSEIRAALAFLGIPKIRWQLNYLDIAI
jgi:hypothetical protein